MEEYRMLREEIQEDYRIVAQYTGILYTAVAAILAFAVKEHNFLLYLIPYVVIVPLFLAGEAKTRAVCKLAAYLYVFHEGGEFRWERRHHHLETEGVQRRNWRSLFPYYLLAGIATALSEYELLSCPWEPAVKMAVGALVALGSLAAVVVMKLNTVDYIAERESMIGQWEKVRAEENGAAPG